MRKYAANTNVTAERSQAEIQSMLLKYGCTSFGFVRRPRQILIGFELRNLRFEMSISLPDPNSDEFTKTATGRARRNHDDALYEQEVRRLYRSLCLLIKAKIVSINEKTAKFEDEFLAYMVTSNGRTVGTWCANLIAKAQENGGPLLLGDGKNG